MNEGLSRRARRNRKSQRVRDLIAETQLGPQHLIQPIFVQDGGESLPIESMPNQKRFCLDDCVAEVKQLSALGVGGVALFPVIEENKKSSDAREAYRSENLNHRAIAAIKKSCPEMLVISDVALDPYSSDGHDGLVDPETGMVLNDPSVEILAKMAVAQAKAGVDIVAPSDMMDGRVGVIRKALDENGFQDVSILSYTAKYASGFYGPFRGALGSAPKKGDKKSYQMDVRNAREAIVEMQMDVGEGADIVMVKPGMPYLDVLWRLRQECSLPIAAYQVSGEYCMLTKAIESDLVGRECIEESLLCLRRAGADIIFTYFAKAYAESCASF